MIMQWLQSLFTPCPWPLRRMGFLREQLAIAARYQRNRSAWDPHLINSRATVLAAAEACAQRQTALILGAGLLHDVPLAELAARFQRVVLADILHLPRNQRRAEALAPNIICAAFDCTAVVAKLWQAGKSLDDETAVSLFRQASPGLPAEIGPGSAPDLTISLNLASQLGYLPADWLLSGRRRAQEFSLRLRQAAARCHIEWLRALPGVRLMITDHALVVRELDDSEAERELLLEDGELSAPLNSWVWRLAPAPEWDRHHHLELEVGAWLFRPPATENMSYAVGAGH